MTSDTVGLIFVEESSSRYPEYLRLQERLISLGTEHNPQTLTQFVLYLHISCTPHDSLCQEAFLVALITGWNKFKSLSALSTYEKFYTTGAF